MQITPTPLKVSQLLGSQNERYVIPAYQRRYSWGQRQVRELWDDINILEGSDTHLLGTIVCLSGPHVAGINTLELVDGQQRLTTVSILLYCLLERLKKDGETNEAQELERLLWSKALNGSLSSKIALDSLDAKQFEILASGTTPETSENPRLAAAFQFVRQQIAACDLQKVRTILYRLQFQAVIIRLDVSDAKYAFKLFETINNRGLSLSPTDIIKNFVLGNAARFGEKNLHLAKDEWASLVRHLDGVSSETFFRHYMMALLKRRVTGSFVVQEFQSAFMTMVKEAESLPDRAWYCNVTVHPTETDDLDDAETIENGEEEITDDDDEIVKSSLVETVSFAEFVQRIVSSAKIYRELVFGLTQNQKLNRRLRNLRLIKAQPSYGFLMHLRAGGTSDSIFEEVLNMTEAFMMRRHTCRERTGENDAVFAKLCSVEASNPITEVRKIYHDYCPEDSKFKLAFASTQFNADRARYCLEQFELREHGGLDELLPAGSDTVQVEHIIPQKIKTKKAKAENGDWPSYLGEDSESMHPHFVARIGNLSLFAGTLNVTASNNPYERKKVSYRKSAIKITSILPDKYPEFRFEQVELRSQALADLAVTLWPAP